MKTYHFYEFETNKDEAFNIEEAENQVSDFFEICPINNDSEEKAKILYFSYKPEGIYEEKINFEVIQVDNKVIKLDDYKNHIKLKASQEIAEILPLINCVPKQQAIFNFNTKKDLKNPLYLITAENPLMPLNEILKKQYQSIDEKNSKSKSLNVHLNIDSEYINGVFINTSDIKLVPTKKKSRHPIEKLEFPKETIEKYIAEKGYKAHVTLQIRNYNTTDTTYNYVTDFQLQQMNHAKVNYLINEDSTIEIDNMLCRGTFEYEIEKDNKIVKWNKNYENRVTDENFIIVDWLRQQGYNADIKHQNIEKEERKELPRINFIFYGHFILVDIPAVCKQDTPFYDDVKKAYLKGNITQNRRLVGNTIFKSRNKQTNELTTFNDDTCYFKDWLLTIDDIDYKVSFKIIDTLGLHGQASLRDLCNNTGVSIEKELITKEEIKDMSKTHIEKPFTVHKYGTGDIVTSEIINNYAAMMKKVYETFKLSKGYLPPALTIGKTVNNLLEAFIVNFMGDDLEEFQQKTAKEKGKYFEKLTFKASAPYLKQLAHSGCNAYLLAKGFGGMARNHRPNINHVVGVLSDKDFTSAYAKTMSQLEYSLGNPLIISLKETSVKKLLKNRKNNLVDNLYVMIIKTPKNKLLKFEQCLFPSWLRVHPDIMKKRKQDSEGYDETGVVNLDSGEVKILLNELQNSPVTSCNIDYIESELTPRQKEEFYNCEVVALAFYDKQQYVKTPQELREKQDNYTTKSSKIYDGETLINNNDCHAWTSFKMSEIVDELIAQRNSYPKSDPLNTMYKLLNNTIYGNQISQYFPTSNMIVGNNITAILRQQMYYSKTSLYMYGAITDGSISNDNEVLFPKYKGDIFVSKRIFEYTGLFFEKISTLIDITQYQENFDCVEYNNKHYLIDDFKKILDQEIQQTGFKYFPNSLILRAKPLITKGVLINKEKINTLYKYSNREINRNDIGIIKPLIGETPIVLNAVDKYYIIAGEKYTIEEGIKLIEKTSTEHPRKVWSNNQLINGYYFVIKKTTDGTKKYKLQQGLHNIEIKKALIEARFHGQTNYETKDINGIIDTKRRGYESLKTQQFAFYFNEDKDRIITDDKFYSVESPASLSFKQDINKYPHLHPIIKSQFIKPKAYHLNRKKWQHSLLMPGEECTKICVMRPLALSKFSFKSERQRDAWIKEDNYMTKQYSYGLELYFLDEQVKHFNIKLMEETFIKLIEQGVNNPRKTLDQNYNLTRKLKKHDWVYENHHAIQLMKQFVNDTEIDDYRDYEEQENDYDDGDEDY